MLTSSAANFPAPRNEISLLHRKASLFYLESGNQIFFPVDQKQILSNDFDLRSIFVGLQFHLRSNI